MCFLADALIFALFSLAGAALADAFGGRKRTPPRARETTEAERIAKAFGRPIDPVFARRRLG